MRTPTSSTYLPAGAELVGSSSSSGSGWERVASNHRACVGFGASPGKLDGGSPPT
jgi:hypothetical protein